jgi:N-acetylmuramoyl-L-alanine amidase
MSWTHIILHHSLTKDGITVSWPAIRKYHVEQRNWQDIGYHFGAEMVGKGGDYEILVGRTLDKPGAHTKGMNTRGIGICCVGNYDVVLPEPAMIERLVYLLKWLRKEYKIPIDNIKGHRDFAPKTCPGKLFDIEYIKELVRR